MSDSAVCSGCGKAFKTRGLTKHQGSCPPYVEQEQRRLARWRNQRGPTFIPFGQKRRRTDAGDDLQIEENDTASASAVDTPFLEESLKPSSLSLDPSIAAQELSNTSVVHDRPQRANRGRLPARFRDHTPEGPAPLPPPSDATTAGIAHPSERDGLSEQDTRTRTAPNRFGLLREYWGPLPEVDPEDELGLDALLDDSLANRQQSAASRRGLTIAPYPNISAYLFGRWFWNGTATKLEKDHADLLEHCILHPDFKPDDLRGLNWKKIDQNLSSTAPDL
ncbi:hypothetical protein NUW54_g12031 [Trametes sanguinea]|uniref:Uncharacterized protein n=1 Tax=Trametes sanguinea TaxID=158606 RepID=A0ACC1N3Y3_9APHY|nr:hypothetical protein NUW54_g12031 [Trametes sanguinea]